VTGEAERLEACPCCRYLSLERRAQLEICPVCMWEDDGSDTPERFSPPNHMTLHDARVNFERFGAVREDLKNKIPVDAQERYYRSL